MQRWFYTSEGRNIGPISTKEIVKAILDGKLDLDSTILSDKDKMWKKAREVPEIMELIHKPLPHPVFDDIDTQQFGSFAELGQPLEDRLPIFYNIPTKLLLWMQLITLGMFEWYWFYKQWNYLRHQKKRRLGSYFTASVIYIFFAYKVFNEIETSKDLNQVKRAPWNARILALLWYIVLPLVVYNPLGKLPVFSGVLSYLLVFMLTSFVLIPVQSYINEVNAELHKAEFKPSFGFYFVVGTSLAMIVAMILLGVFL